MCTSTQACLVLRGAPVQELGAVEIEAFLSHLATDKRGSAVTQNQALAAILFLSIHVLGQPPETLREIVRAKRSLRVPVVRTPAELAALSGAMRGTRALMAGLLYGAGLRLLECAQLRVKDVDLDRQEIVVRDGKGRKDRVTMLPAWLVAPVRAHREPNTRHTSKRARGGWRCRMRLIRSHPTRVARGRGSGCFHRRGRIAMRRRGARDGTSFTRLCSQGLCVMR